MKILNVNNLPLRKFYKKKSGSLLFIVPSGFLDLPEERFPPEFPRGLRRVGTMSQILNQEYKTPFSYQVLALQPLTLWIEN